MPCKGLECVDLKSLGAILLMPAFLWPCFFFFGPRWMLPQAILSLSLTTSRRINSKSNHITSCCISSQERLLSFVYHQAFFFFLLLLLLFFFFFTTGNIPDLNKKRWILLKPESPGDSRRCNPLWYPEMMGYDLVSPVDPQPQACGFIEAGQLSSGTSLSHVVDRRAVGPI